MLNLFALKPKDVVALRGSTLPNSNELEVANMRRAAHKAILWRLEWRSVLLLTRVGFALARWRTNHRNTVSTR